MKRKFTNRQRQNERGLTIIVVAFTLVAFLALAALSIDVAQLYVARGEAQRAADAAALAGAKMFVTSGFTSAQNSGAPIADATNGLICQAATAQAQAAANQNTVVGASGTPAITVQVQCPPSGVSLNAANPMVSVIVTRIGVPTFFARIWGKTGTTVSASATAEAYNPSNNPTPIATAIKPWLLPNCNPWTTGCNGPYFVDPSSGQILQNGSFIGRTIDLNIITTGAGQANGSGILNAYSLDLPTTSSPVCPTCALGQSSYFQGIACSSQELLKCQDMVGNGTNFRVERFGVSGTSNSGGRCLIHADNDGLNQGQDSLVSLGPPAIIAPGNNNPNSDIAGQDVNTSRSDSIVTVPLYDGSALCTGGRFGGCIVAKPVLGFLQLAITQAIPSGSGTNAQIEAVIVNAAGCSNSPSGTTITGSGTSPVPVRLIHN
jgi:hypothetical protein